MPILVSNRNVTIECSNGLAVSLAYGDGSYSTNRDGKAPVTKTGAVECHTVEVAILDLTKSGDSHFVLLPCDRDQGVHGWCSADQVARVIGAVADGDLDKANEVLSNQ
jgi:hypothetical protein